MVVVVAAGFAAASGTDHHEMPSDAAIHTTAAIQSPRVPINCTLPAQDPLASHSAMLAGSVGTVWEDRAVSALILNDIDLSDYALYRNGFPHDVFTTLRREAPVWRHPDTEILREGDAGPFWVLSRHDDLRAVDRDSETFTAYDGAQIRDTAQDRKGKMLISMDGPPHTRLRRLVSRGFPPRMLDNLEGHLRWRTDRILDDVVAKGGEVDFVRDVAEQLPLHVIADIIGIPEAERA